MSQITDATGDSYGGRVFSDNHFAIAGRTLDTSHSEALAGRAYNFNTGTISLTTTASENGLIYMKNTGDNVIVVTGFFYLLGNQATSGDTLVRIYRNPTTGTLISAGTAAVPVNRDFRSSNTATGTFLMGADAKTVTNGTVAIESIFNGVGRQAVIVGAVIIGKGNSIAITIKPASAQDVQVAIAFYEKVLEV